MSSSTEIKIAESEDAFEAALQHMMFGFGDTLDSDPAAVQLLARLAREHIANMTQEWTRLTIMSGAAVDATGGNSAAGIAGGPDAIDGGSGLRRPRASSFAGSGSGSGAGVNHRARSGSMAGGDSGRAGNGAIGLDQSCLRHLLRDDPAALDRVRELVRATETRDRLLLERDRPRHSAIVPNGTSSGSGSSGGGANTASAAGGSVGAAGAKPGAVVARNAASKVSAGANSSAGGGSSAASRGDNSAGGGAEASRKRKR